MNTVYNHNKHIDVLLSDLKFKHPVAFDLLATDNNFTELVRFAKTEEFEEVPADTPSSYFETYTEPDGQVVRMGNKVLGTIDKLRNLSSGTRINMMRLDPVEMMEYINKKQLDDCVRAYELFTAKWYWKADDAIQVSFEDAGDNSTYLNIQLTGKQIRRLLKAAKLPSAEIKKIFEFFEGDNREVKRKDKEGNWIM